MKKETVLAILLGIGAGVLIALWVIRGTQGKNANNQLVTDEKITPSITISNSVTEPLLISDPEDGFVSDKDTITIKGKTHTGSLVVVQTQIEEHVFKADEEEFSQEIALSEGENTIRITSYDDKNVETRSLLVYFVEGE